MSYKIDSGFLNDRYGANSLSGYVRSDPRGLEIERTAKNDYRIVSAGDMKTYLNVNHDRHDEMITKMIDTATKTCEDYLNIAFLTSTYEAYWLWVWDYVRLPYRNQAVTEIKSIDIDGNETVLTSGTDFVVLGNRDKIVRFKTAMDKSVLVTFTAGLKDSPDKLDTSYFDAVKSQVKFLYARDFKTDFEVEASLKNGLAVEAEMILNNLR